MDGRAVADWLRAKIDPSQIYDHRDLHYLAEVGITYDERAHALMADGAVALVPTFTPAELMKHPLVKPDRIHIGNAERIVLGFDIAAAVHQLAWPAEMPPGQSLFDQRMNFAHNVRSIAERNGVGYRDEPSGGWWKPPPTYESLTRRRR